MPDRAIGGHSTVCQKKQATPAKVQAIMNTVEKVIAENTSDAAAGKRRGNARKALRDLFAEMARLGQRSKCPSSS
ncbi:hypothetical protein MTO96_033914 [Rhipicephalus appendiculatus]